MRMEGFENGEVRAPEEPPEEKPVIRIQHRPGYENKPREIPSLVFEELTPLQQAVLTEWIADLKNGKVASEKAAYQLGLTEKRFAEILNEALVKVGELYPEEWGHLRNLGELDKEI